MNQRDQQLAMGMIEPQTKNVAGIKLRPFSYGSMQLAYMLKLSLFTDESKEDGEPDDEEKQRQIVTFAWMQAAPLDEVIDTVHDGTVKSKVLRFSLGISFDMIPGLLAEINRIGNMIAASGLRIESRHPSDTEEAPGKS